MAHKVQISTIDLVLGSRKCYSLSPTSQEALWN